MDGREQRGKLIALKGGIEKGMKGYIVPSQYGNGIYLVKLGADANCTCPDCQTRNVKCKHQYAVQYFLKKDKNEDGTTTVTETKRVTYPQDWKSYNKAQTSEIRLFDELLRDLVETIDEPEQKMGRPRLSLRESLFCGIQKVYSRLSSRRAYTLYTNAEGKGQINKPPNFNAINKLLAKKEITPILEKLLAVSALPLKSVETSFATDSTGFSTTRFGQYCVEKHKQRKQHKWVKAHVLVGTKTNVIVGAKITEENGADSPQFAPLVREAHENGFTMKEITADKAYSSRDNTDAAFEVGATPYIPYRSNATGKARGSLMWSKMYHYFMLNRDEFMEHYHKRSNVETAIGMVKAKFGDKLKAKKYDSQVNEVYCRLIAHNLCCLIQEMHELGVNPKFKSSSSKTGTSPQTS